METTETNQDTVNQGTTSSGTEGQQSTVEKIQSTEQAASSEASKSGEQVRDSQDAEEFVKDDEGNEYVPRKAFEERLKKLTAQKYDAQNQNHDQFLETLNSNPEVKEKVLKALGIDPAKLQGDTKDNASNPSMWQEFLSPLEPQHQAHYTKMGQALANEFETYFENRLDEALKPIISALGEDRLNRFKSTIPDYEKFQGQIKEIISSGRAKSLEDAYILASHSEKVKGIGSSQDRKTQEIKDRKTNLPIKGPVSTPSGNMSQKPKTIREALEQAAKDTNYIRR